MGVNSITCECEYKSEEIQQDYYANETFQVIRCSCLAEDHDLTLTLVVVGIVITKKIVKTSSQLRP